MESFPWFREQTSHESDFKGVPTKKKHDNVGELMTLHRPR